MKISHALLTVCIATFLITGCSTCCSTGGKSPKQLASNFINRQDIVKTTQEIYPEKNPKTVALYTSDQSPHAAYRVIGIATVSKYNLFGVHRDESILHSMMQNLAASIGGDGLININANERNIQASVIAFQKILI